jgi:biopolymer transport protein ExbD/biopolymer transport protein TolR
LRGHWRRATEENTMPQLSRQTGSTLSEINMIPFIDVVLVLLIIFMITAPILQSGIEVDVPKTKTIREINEQRLVVTLNKQQLIYLGDEPVNIHELGDKVNSKLGKKQDAVFVRCDETVPFGIFASVIDTLRQSGINNISIVTEPLTDRNKAK